MPGILTAYFSHVGQNYFNGSIRTISKGNTKVVAEIVEKLTKGTIFCIDTVKKYPEDYTECTNVAQAEKRQNARPELTEEIQDISQYETIILGYPNWWGTMPMAVCTFLEKYDFSGKTILPFCTNEGSGMGSSVNDIKKICSAAHVAEGLAIRGSDVGSSQQAVKSWLAGNGITV
jgi:flavodoxin